jgi:hypothetical protein
LKLINYLQLALFAALFASCNTHTSQPQQGELDTTFQATFVDTVTPAPPPMKTEEEQLRDEGWEQTRFRNGMMPDGYNYRPSSVDLDNALTVSVGGGTDVALKVMSLATGICVRYVFIDSGSAYSIRNLPEDRYYLKIAYGRDWISKTENNRCMGRFLHQALYKRSEEILDFNRRSTLEGVSVPSYELRLDVVADQTQDSFNSSGISEEEFNN